MPPQGPLRNDLYEGFYVVLVSFFIAALVACNLVFLKFFSIRVALPWSAEYRFEQSVGLLAYPFTFLVTDILSEVYGRHRANRVVMGGFFATGFALVLVLVGQSVPAKYDSPVDDETFSLVFGLGPAAMTASMVAYLVAQFMDIRLFHFWRRLTGGKHLWLRNNASTFTSQVMDTALVLGVLCLLEALSWRDFSIYFVNGVVFKWLVAAADTPLFYGCVHLFRCWFPDQVAATEAGEMGWWGRSSTG